MRRQPSIVELVGVLDRTLFSWGFIKLNAIARKLMMLAICAVCLLSTGCYRIAALAFGEGNALFETGSKLYFVTRKVVQDTFSGRSYAPLAGIELPFVLIDLPYIAHHLLK